MATHDFEPTQFDVTIGSHEPVLRAAAGDTIRTWCVDAGGHDQNGEQLTSGPNPQTGPFFIEGAEPGDTLAVRFDRIRPNRDRGLSGRVVAPHVVDPSFVAELPPKDGALDSWILDLEQGTGRLENPPPGLESSS